VLCRQAEARAQLPEHDSYAAIEALEHHWDRLSDERKETFAQMAVLTRRGAAPCPAPRTARVSCGPVDTCSLWSCHPCYCIHPCFCSRP
jgi:hypothetical protein